MLQSLPWILILIQLFVVLWAIRPRLSPSLDFFVQTLTNPQSVLKTARFHSSPLTSPSFFPPTLPPSQKLLQSVVSNPAISFNCGMYFFCQSFSCFSFFSSLPSAASLKNLPPKMRTHTKCSSSGGLIEEVPCRICKQASYTVISELLASSTKRSASGRSLVCLLKLFQLKAKYYLLGVKLDEDHLSLTEAILPYLIFFQPSYCRPGFYLITWPQARRLLAALSNFLLSLTLLFLSIFFLFLIRPLFFKIFSEANLPSQSLTSKKAGFLLASLSIFFCFLAAALSQFCLFLASSQILSPLSSSTEASLLPFRPRGAASSLGYESYSSSSSNSCSFKSSYYY